VADHTKVGRQALAFLCEQGDVDTLIVNDALTPEQRTVIDESAVRLILAGEGGNGSAGEGFRS
jgi:DeoR/GlpR family transcriptional regulator of sugar metabolism